MLWVFYWLFLESFIKKYQTCFVILLQLSIFSKTVNLRTFSKSKLPNGGTQFGFRHCTTKFCDKICDTPLIYQKYSKTEFLQQQSVPSRCYSAVWDKIFPNKISWKSAFLSGKNNFFWKIKSTRFQVYWALRAAPTFGVIMIWIMVLPKLRSKEYWSSLCFFAFSKRFQGSLFRRGLWKTQQQKDNRIHDIIFANNFHFFSDRRTKQRCNF